MSVHRHTLKCAWVWIIIMDMLVSIVHLFIITYCPLFQSSIYCHYLAIRLHYTLVYSIAETISTSHSAQWSRSMTSSPSLY